MPRPAGVLGVVQVARRVVLTASARRLPAATAAASLLGGQALLVIAGEAATSPSIVNQPGASSYPISGYSWALIYTRQPSQASGQALVTMLDWLTHDGQAYAAANLYVPLAAQVRQLAHTMLGQVTGPGGTHLLG